MADHNKKVFFTLKGRGVDNSATGRFESFKFESDLSDYENVYKDLDESERPSLRTEFFKDASRTIVTENKSPDIGFRYSMNFYRGCEHGCAYCYARPTHEYLGLSAGLDFETKIFVKDEAPDLLREKLMSKSWRAECIAISGVTDCYQPAERKFELTRRCLEILLEFKNPVALITKNSMITRDLDLLKELAAENLVFAMLSVTTLDPELGRVLEPRTSAPKSRLLAIETLANAGVPVGVNVAPVIPGLTDREMPEILRLAAEAGATVAGYVPVRLPYSVKDIFADWLEAHRPEAKSKILNTIRSMRGGELNDSSFGSRMNGEGPIAENMRQIFDLFTRKYKLNQSPVNLSTDKFKRPQSQMELW